MRYRNTKRVTQPCRIVVGSSGVVSFYAPFNENFLEEFKGVFNKNDRHWNPDRKIWQIKAEGIAALVEVLSKYYNKIEGLDALIESPYDVLRVTPDASDKLVKMSAKVLRQEYHPDRISNSVDALALFPELEGEVERDYLVHEARTRATAFLQEVGEAEKLIMEIREMERESVQESTE